MTQPAGRCLGCGSIISTFMYTSAACLLLLSCVQPTAAVTFCYPYGPRRAQTCPPTVNSSKTVCCTSNYDRYEVNLFNTDVCCTPPSAKTTWIVLGSIVGCVILAATIVACCFCIKGCPLQEMTGKGRRQPGGGMITATAATTMAMGNPQQQQQSAYPMQQVPGGYPQTAQPVSNAYPMQQQQAPGAYPQQQQQAPGAYPQQQQQMSTAYPAQAAPGPYQQQQAAYPPAAYPTAAMATGGAQAAYPMEEQKMPLNSEQQNVLMMSGSEPPPYHVATGQ